MRLCDVIIEISWWWGHFKSFFVRDMIEKYVFNKNVNFHWKSRKKGTISHKYSSVRFMHFERLTKNRRCWICKYSLKMRKWEKSVQLHFLLKCRWRWIFNSQLFGNVCENKWGVDHQWRHISCKNILNPIHYIFCALLSKFLNIQSLVGKYHRVVQKIYYGGFELQY